MIVLNLYEFTKFWTAVMTCNEEHIVLQQIAAISEVDTKLNAKICKHLPKFGVPK